MARKAEKRGGKRLGVRYIVNARGEILDVVLPIAMYKRLLRRLEDAEDFRDARDALKDLDTIPWEQAKRELGLEDAHDNAPARKRRREPRESLVSAKRRLAARKRRAASG